MKNSLVLTLSAISLLTACSGGNNGFSEDAAGGNGGNVPATGATIDITSANAMMITKLSYQAALSSGALADFSGGSGLLASGPGGLSKIDGSLAVSNKVGNTTANVVIPATTESCIPSGTMTLSGEIADPLTPTLTAGDFFDITYAMCDDGFSVIDGALFYEVDAFNGDFVAGTYSLTMTATFTDFQVAADTDTLVSNGDLTVSIDTLQFPQVEAEASGNSLTIDGNASRTEMTNFTSLHSQNTGLDPSPYTQSSSGTLDSTLLAGVVSYSTPTEFEGFDADYPSAGVFVVTGSNNSSARLTAIDSVNVVIEIDTDGDGSFDEIFETTWVELEAS